METLEKIQTKHKAILTAFNQVESIIAPIHTGEGKNDILNFNDFNLERLAKNTDLLSSEFCGISITSEGQRLPADHPKHTGKPDFKWQEPCYSNGKVLIKIEGENFGYEFAPQQICHIKKQVEKSFKAVESFTKQANVKHRPKIAAPAQPFKMAKIEPIKASGLLLTDNKLLKNDSMTLPSDSNKDYICHSINDELKTVNFQLEGKYIEQIHAGAKVEDYRAINPVNAKKLCDHIKKEELAPDDHYVTHFKEIWRVKKDLTHVRFFNGYKSDRKELLCELKRIEVNTFRKYIPEGMKPGTSCFTLFLGQIVVSKNFKS